MTMFSVLCVSEAYDFEYQDVLLDFLIQDAANEATLSDKQTCR
jgi:hypothetical protein